MTNIVSIALNLLSMYLGANQQKQAMQGQSSAQIAVKDSELLALKKKDGAVTVLLGTRGTGKSELAYRLAEFIDKSVYAVSPEQEPPIWIERIAIEDIFEKVKPGSTLIMDDLPAYASNRDYNNKVVQTLERLIPLVRHEKKLHLIFCSQSAAQADKYILDCDCAFFKPLGLLFDDLERPNIRKIYRSLVEPEFEGRSDWWIVRHAYMLSRRHKGIIEFSRVS